jgi:hypothetical protein
MTNPPYWGFDPPATPRVAIQPDSIAATDAYDTEHGDAVEDTESSVQTHLPRQEQAVKVSPTALLRQRVTSAIRSTLSAVHNADSTVALQIIQRIESSRKVLSALTPEYREIVLAVLEVLKHEASVLSTGRLNLYSLPILEEYAQEVKDEIFFVTDEVGVSTPADPHAYWQDMVEIVQRAATKHAALTLAQGIEDKKPLFDLMPLYRKVEPPTSVKAISRERGTKTAKEVAEEHRVISSSKAAYRFSSGLRSLDGSYTGTNEALGFISPGTFVVVMGQTGTGKSSFANSIVPSISMDLKNWGLEHGKQVLFHTEEETIDKIRGFRMDKGQKYHHLSDNMIVKDCGTSRRQLAYTLYDLVKTAEEISRFNKRPIVEYLPYVVQIDYLQAIQESTDRDPATAAAITAEFFLRGVCAWNPDEMHKFSGVNFLEYAGIPWPEGMTDHRVAVVAYAQLIKIDEATQYYQSGRKGVQLSDFTLFDQDNNPYWKVQDGDLRLFDKSQMRGSGIIAQNAHAILILHRSVPYNNPAVRDALGELHLQDTRARVLYNKSRSGSSRVYAPLRFDVQADGGRAQFFDEAAEDALSRGTLKNIDPSYQDPGDPILPIRPFRNKLAETRYI